MAEAKHSGAPVVDQVSRRNFLRAVAPAAGIAALMVGATAVPAGHNALGGMLDEMVENATPMMNDRKYAVVLRSDLAKMADMSRGLI